MIVEEFSNWFFQQISSVLWCLAVLVGIFSIVSSIKSVISIPLSHAIQKSSLKQRYGGKSAWVIIAGGSSKNSIKGIDKSFAFHFASQGFNIILTNFLSQNGLKETQKQINEKYPEVQTKAIFINNIKEVVYQKQSESQWYLNNNLDKLPITIVVNTAEIQMQSLKRVGDQPLQKQLQIIEQNCIMATALHYTFVERFHQEIHQRKEKIQPLSPYRLIINVSSALQNIPSSYLGVYGAIKIFIDKLTRSTQIEYPEIDMISCRPNFKIQFNSEKNSHACSKFIQGVMKDVASKKGYSYGNWWFGMKKEIYNCLVPEWLFDRIWNGSKVKSLLKELKQD